MRETAVERAHTKEVEGKGGLSLKWVSPGYAGVTDRIDFYDVEWPTLFAHSQIRAWIATGSEPTPQQVRDLLKQAVGMMIQFTETKRPGGKAESHQLRFHAQLRRRGFTVNVIDRTKTLR